jgi:hypothetical protein
MCFLPREARREEKNACAASQRSGGVAAAAEYTQPRADKEENNRRLERGL